MRVLTYGLGLLLLAGFVVLALAGVPAAIGVLVTAGAVLAMIALGGQMGGRHGSARASGPPAGGAPETGPDGGTMEG